MSRNGPRSALSRGGLLLLWATVSLAPAHVLAAKDLVADGAWQAALAAVDRAIEADAAFAEAHVVKQGIYSRKGRGYAEAGPFVKEFDERASQRDVSEARRFQGVVDRAPDDPAALYELGEIYAVLSRQTADTLLRLYPDSYRARRLRGEAFEKGARLEFDKALAEFQKAAELRPDGPGVQYAVGRVLWKMNRFDSSTNCSGLAPPSDAAPAQVDQARLLTAFGQTLLAGRHWGSALEVFLLALG